jgi:hypothetical protein
MNKNALASQILARWGASRWITPNRQIKQVDAIEKTAYAGKSTQWKSKTKTAQQFFSDKQQIAVKVFDKE